MIEPRRNQRAVVLDGIAIRTSESDTAANPRDLDEALRILAKMLVRRARKEGKILGEIQLERSPTVHRMGQRFGTETPGVEPGGLN